MEGLINRLLRMKEGCVRDGAEGEGGKWEYSEKGVVGTLLAGNIPWKWPSVDCWCLLC